MNQTERLEYLLRFLLREGSRYRDIELPNSEDERRQLLRALMNVRPAVPIDERFLEVQNAYLQEEARIKGIVDAESIPMISGEPSLVLWQGDITRLKVDAIVNAANSALLGCFVPNHGCIDNVIHSYAGVQLRQECAAIMQEQGHEEPTGKAKITKGYNLPCKHILHTVGPIISGELTRWDCELLASCYSSCLALALEYGLKSIAFCCISTGEFRFPQEQAAEIAISTVRDFVREHDAVIKVIYNVFKESDYEIYKRLLG